ncbi:hypothetical protein BJ165DRAFT_398841 [Panaeolus papilionaceus]|nr:hypothetical protein BJ165DRAFT_398841 [Panaeolus papilionaceus]
MASTNKRPRTSSASTDANTSIQVDGAQPTHNPPSKAIRIIPFNASEQDTATTTSSGIHPLLCNLPPTCHHHPTPIADTNELERHYASHHAHVCAIDNCRCVFPEARLLELHQTECHDPLAAILKERGEKIFECHIAAPTCGRKFQTPKARRLHLIQVHSYPKQYFFAVTNKGVGGLLRRWGEGASLVRGPWKPRDTTAASAANPSSNEVRWKDGMDEDEDSDDAEEQEEEDDEDHPIQEDEEEEEEEAIDQSTPRIRPIRFNSGSSPHSSVSSKITIRGGGPHQRQSSGGAMDEAGISGITNAIESLSLVPDSVRFGRGGKRGFIGGPRGRGISRGGRGRGGGGRGGRGGAQEGGEYHQQMEVDNTQHPGVIPLRGRGAAAANIRGGRGPKVVNPNNSIAVRARARGRGRGAPP